VSARPRDEVTRRARGFDWRRGSLDDPRMDPKPAVSPEQSLRTLRMIWAALLMGQVIFLVIVMWLIRQPAERPAIEPDVRRTLLVAAGAWLVMALPMGYFIRLKTYEKGRGPDGAVSPGSYVTGNIILLALCEGVSLFAIVGILLSRQVAPFIYITLVAIAVQAMNFPTGAPLAKR
jgi:hypothetical protein